MLDASIPARNSALVNNRPLDVVPWCPIEQRSCRFYESVVRPALDHSCELPRWNFSVMNTSIGGQSGCADGHANLNLYLQQNNVDRAQQSLLKALTIQPGLTGAELDLAKTYKSQGKTAQAVKMLQAVIASEPEQQEAHYLLFGLYKEQGEMGQARKELETFQRITRGIAEEEEQRRRLDSTDR